MKILTVQHTQSVQHTNGMIGSWADWDLTDLGVTQATRLGRGLAREIGNEKYRVYSSDLLRARRTADILAGFLGVEPSFTKELREMHLGEAVGKSKEWARQNAACPLWPGTIDWPISLDDRPFAGAESKREVYARLVSFYQEYLENAEENAIIVSHGGALSLFFAFWLGPYPSMLETCHFSSRAGGVSVLQEEGGRRTVVCFNYISFMRE